MRSTSAVSGAIVAVALGVLSPASSVQAADGVLIVQRTTIDGKQRTTEVQIEPQRMRAEVDGGFGGSRVMVFEAPKQVMYLIDPARKGYSEMTKADVDRIGTQMTEAMAKMKAMLEKLPPEKRGQLEAMVKGGGPAAGPGFAAAPIEYRKTGMSKVGKWPCDTYEGHQNGRKISDVCTVTPEALGLKAADFAVTRQVAQFVRSLIPQSSDTLFQVGRPEEKGFSGIPVRNISTASGRTVVSEVVDVARRTFDKALFAVPAGFTKDPYPFGPR